jgi:hypothetical protein
MPRKISLSSIVMATILAVSVVVALIQFGKFSIAQGQGNLTTGNLTLTPEQKDAICNPNNPLSKLNPVNTTESKICGIPVTVRPPLSNMTTPNMTTGEEALPPSASSITPSANTTTGIETEAPPTNLAPSAAPPPGE